VRFPAPVPVGSRVRGSAELLEAAKQKDGSLQAKVRVTVEVEGQEKPGCVIETISRYYPA
jgi:acyl dehydratase